MLAFYSGDLATAQAEFESALAGYERTGFGDPTALVTYSRLASVCLLTFELDRAVELCEECLRRCDELGEQWARGTALWARGAARWLSGDNAAAIEDALACLRIKEPLGDLHTIAMSFDLLSVCLVATGDFERAAVLHGASEQLWTLLNAPVLMGPAYAENRKSAADAARSALGEERFDALAGARLRPVAVRRPRGGEGRGAGRAPRRHRRAWHGSEVAHPARAGDRRTGRRRPRQPGDRRAAVPLQAHGRLPHRAHLHQAGASPPGPSSPPGSSSAGNPPDPVTGATRPDLRGNEPIPIFIKIGGRYLPCRHQSFTVGRQSLRMSDDSGSGLSRRQMIAAGTTGLIAATAAGPARAAARGRV